MAALEFVLFWTPVVLGVLIAASYIGTKLALRSYFADDDSSITDVVRVEDADQE